uniref:Uncharacterized protein n=1 Tax=Anguilla anguilla TaxID=7936 RepID=A0A0E9RYI9_ANGAN
MKRLELRELAAEVRLRELEVEAMWAGSRRQSPEFYVSRNISLVFSCGGGGKIALGKKTLGCCCCSVCWWVKPRMLICRCPKSRISITRW